ncbi:MAG: FumA C-terminus/TtdB family hydratase beta subunit [Elusimicrobiota bacterium]|jgi:fumarate hydratase subunit beta|nr:FumA C-terminus/TtdB family hydratase beta subunit [Elusimicrobiota bacterium]
MDKKFMVNDLVNDTSQVKVGDKILLSGTIYTARDAAHKKITDLLDCGQKPPFEIKGAAIYYCGPAPAKPNEIIGSCGPTTSARMDIFTPRLLKEGLKIMIGKGKRSDEVTAAIAQNQALYFVATGGIGALLSKTVKAMKIFAFEELGAEAVYELSVEDMPLICATDSTGNSIFNQRRK